MGNAHDTGSRLLDLRRKRSQMPFENAGVVTFTRAESSVPNHVVTPEDSIEEDSSKKENQTRDEKAEKSKSKIRCPSCKTVLIAPSKEAVFGCPCGQVLMSSSVLNKLGRDLSISTTVAHSIKVRCPRCLTSSEMSPGTILIPCPSCGLHMKHPNADEEEHSDFSFVDSSTGSLRKSNRRLSRASKVPIFRRRKVTIEKLGWRRIWDEAESLAVMENEIQVLNHLQSDDVSNSSESSIREKLTRCLIECSSPTEMKMDELLKLARRGPEELASRYSKALLRQLLDDRLLDHSSCHTGLELATRFFVYEWSNHQSAREAIARTKSTLGFVRCFVHRPNDLNLTLESIRAAEFIVSTRIGTEGVSEAAAIGTDEVLQVVTFPFQEKVLWLQQHTEKLRIPWEKGHVRIRVRRTHLLEDSFNAFLHLKPSDMHRFFRFEFIGEPGQDAGGVAREWFRLVLEECFNLDLGLFSIADTGNVTYHLAPSRSTEAEEQNRLKYLRFFGRVLGKAIFDGHNVAAHLTRVLYKHMLAWPITEDDLEGLDLEIFKSSRAVRECEDMSSLALNFTMTLSSHHHAGACQTIDLIPNGSEVEVTNANRDEYLDLRLKQLTIKSISSGLKELLVGLYETIPYVLLSVFDFTELELLLCGLPNIDVEDWKQNTVYRGAYETLKENHPVIQMFWEAMNEVSPEDRARFLQFATGSARVPVQGFAALQGVDGFAKLFTIESIPLEFSVFPRAHTCFNRIDLPPYSNKEELKFRMAQALNYEGIGFQLE